MFFKKLRRMQAERYAAWREDQAWLFPAEEETRLMRREARKVHEIELFMERTGDFDAKHVRKAQALREDYIERAQRL